MKKTLLFFGFALLGLMFFACQKDEPVHEQSALDSSEMVSVERTHHHCGHNPNDCLTTCISYGMCCCTIEWYYEDSALEPIPTFCVAKDICVEDPDCVIVCAETNWPGNIYSFCGSGSTTLTYLCVSPNTAISITNPHNVPLFVTLICDGATNPPTGYVIPGFTTIQIGFSGCRHQPGC